jgi:transcriptional regulator with XRE-family HTH domain
MHTSKDNGFKKFLVTVGTNLRRIRTSRELKIETVANVTRIPPYILGQIENGDYNWTVRQISRLCAYYEVTMKDIVSMNK